MLSSRYVLYFHAVRKLLQLIGYCGDDKRDDTFRYSRPETRCGCTTCVKISLRNGYYDVYEFEASHNQYS
jgi:zinc finger SWIM domain-containing protein 3